MRGIVVAGVVVLAGGMVRADYEDPIFYQPPQTASMYGLRPPVLRAKVVLDEPSFSIARAYGVAAWTDACPSRGALRIDGDADEVASYVHAWCGGSRERVLAELAALTDAHTRGLADAVHRDVLALLADTRDASTALAWMTEHDIARDGALADAYIALDRPADALAIASAKELDLADDHARCMQLGRQAYEGGDREREEVLRMAARGDDKDCKQIATYLRCPLVYVRWLQADDVAAAIAYEVQACAALRGEADVAAAAVLAQWPYASFEYRLWSPRWRSYATAIAGLDSETLRDPNVVAIALAAYDSVTGICEPSRKRADLERAIASDRRHPESPLAAAMVSLARVIDRCESAFAKRYEVRVKDR